ncbi:MAG: energy transducer TonB [Myxococcota bacterium]
MIALSRAVILATLLSLPNAVRAQQNDQSRARQSDTHLQISPSAVEIVRRVNPSFPKKAIKEGYRHEECLAQLFINEDGKTESVEVLQGCPGPFQKPTQKAARKWRFSPYVGTDDKVKKVTFVLRFRYTRPK